MQLFPSLNAVFQPRILIALLVVGSAALVTWLVGSSPSAPSSHLPSLNYLPRNPSFSPTGYMDVMSRLKPWAPSASLKEISLAFASTPPVLLRETEGLLADPTLPEEPQIALCLQQSSLLNFMGKTRSAYDAQTLARSIAESMPQLAEKWIYTIIYFQGLTSLRLGEDENCILCRGESSCILPIVKAAVHANTRGSRQAIHHFTEYLDQFPDDLEVQWLLNIAHMTLGEYPDKVAPRHLVKIDHYLHSEFDIGRFRDIGARVGVNRLNFQGGGIMDDFDNDGLLDIVTTSNDLSQSMAYYQNNGEAGFKDRTKEAGLEGQFGGLFCVQADYDNDGNLDLFVPRGAWMPQPIRPSLLHNDGHGNFVDVTREAGLNLPLNSLSACWADFDNDGFIDLFVSCGPQQSRLYHNLGNGTFEDVARHAGVAGDSKVMTWRSACWIDFNRDGFPDLFVNSLRGFATLYRNNGDATFTDVTSHMGIRGPHTGFACWAFDYDNDGWPDIFATCYEYPLRDLIRGLQGKPHTSNSNCLYHNLQGQGFNDVTKEAGLDIVFATMGCNFGDFDNDGFLDLFLGAGGPDLSVLTPSRMFKNVAGKRFSEITASSGTGNLQKGHSVACGDWNRNGSIDIFIEMGGVTHNTRYHNILYDNPGQGNNWLGVKLTGKKSNRSAIGARIQAVIEGQPPRTVHRVVTSGSSFGANPLEVHLGLRKAARVARLEVYWPTTKTTQVFENVAANQSIEITEGSPEVRPRKMVSRK